MKSSQKVFRVGTRSSKLALAQTKSALGRIEALVPSLKCEMVPCSSPGDRDQTTDLRISATDFFTHDLDEAVLNGDIDAAIHSAKDVPDDPSDNLDWVWLPWTEDRRDVIIVPLDKTIEDLPDNIKIGVSSERREQYSITRFPNARLLNIRGNIGERLAQLDAGKYDLIIMAAAALVRLNLKNRISEYIPLSELPSPEGQGVLCMTFRTGSHVATELRKLFVKSAAFVGAGAGKADMCTQAGINAIERCDVCLYDALLDPALLNHLSPAAIRIPVGKRSGAHSVPQAVITKMILDEIRKGKSLVRLKGGDPGMFGRLAEEVSALDTLLLPSHVIPGVSSLNAATTGTGMLLTKRGISRGFCVMTPRKQGGGIIDIGTTTIGELPIVFFMALSVIDNISQQLQDNGTNPDTSVAVVFNAGQDDEEVIRSTLADITNPDSPIRKSRSEAPALIIVGECATDGFNKNQGAFDGKRILLTCSETIIERASGIVRDLGGAPICRPLIKLSVCDHINKTILSLRNYDWLIVTSPSAVKILLQQYKRLHLDLRILPKIMTCGKATSDELRKAGLQPDAEPSSDFGCKGLLNQARHTLKTTDSVLRVSSDHASSYLSDELKPLCAELSDLMLYKNEMIRYDKLPSFDIVFFASGSAVDSFISQWGAKALVNKNILAIGKPTARILQKNNITDVCVSPESDLTTAFTTMAGIKISRKLEKQL